MPLLMIMLIVNTGSWMVFKPESLILNAGKTLHSHRAWGMARNELQNSDPSKVMEGYDGEAGGLIFKNFKFW